MEFLDLIETVRSEDASIQRLFGRDGDRGVRGLVGASSRLLSHVTEAAIFLAEVLQGRRPVYHLQEAMTTSDFPLLFGYVLDRSVLAAYREWPAVWPSIAKRRAVANFRTIEEIPPNTGADGRLDQVEEQAPYPAAAVSEQARITWSVKKYGRRIDFSWETRINDDLDLLADMPQRLGRAARRTETRGAVDLYVDASGPHAALYTASNKNIINIANGASVNNPPLSIAGLQDGMKVLANIKDESGEPIMIEAVTLVVPPALEIVAQNILNAVQLELTTAGGVRDGGSGEQRLIVQNWMRNRVTLQVDPYIPMVATTANGNTSWFLFANPSTGRPALQVGFLRGHEEPEIRIKEPNSRRVGGGEINPLDGDFETDSIAYRVRHVLGFARIDARGTVASNGSGS